MLYDGEGAKKDAVVRESQIQDLLVTPSAYEVFATAAREYATSFGQSELRLMGLSLIENGSTFFHTLHEQALYSQTEQTYAKAVALLLYNTHDSAAGFLADDVQKEYGLEGSVEFCKQSGVPQLDVRTYMKEHILGNYTKLPKEPVVYWVVNGALKEHPEDESFITSAAHMLCGLHDNGTVLPFHQQLDDIAHENHNAIDKEQSRTLASLARDWVHVLIKNDNTRRKYYTSLTTLYALPTTD